MVAKGLVVCTKRHYRKLTQIGRYPAHYAAVVILHDIEIRLLIVTHPSTSTRSTPTALSGAGKEEDEPNRISRSMCAG